MLETTEKTGKKKHDKNEREDWRTVGEFLINPLSFTQPAQSHGVCGFPAARSLADLQIFCWKSSCRLGVQSLCALVCDFTDRHYVPTPWTGQSAGVWAAGAWDRAGLFHAARLLGHRWHGPASESVLQEAVRSAGRPTEGQLQPYDCACAGDAQLFFAAWCNSELARCSIGEGALRPLCDVCRRCGRWVPRRSLTSSPSFSFSVSSVSSSSFFLSLGLLFTSFVFFFISIPPVSLPLPYIIIASFSTLALLFYFIFVQSIKSFLNGKKKIKVKRELQATWIQADLFWCCRTSFCTLLPARMRYACFVSLCFRVFHLDNHSSWEHQRRFCLCSIPLVDLSA